MQAIYGGRKIYTHSMNTTFLETADWSTREKFRRWHEMRDWVKNTGMLASAYKVTGQLVLYNDIPAVVRTINLRGLWPDVIAEVQMDGAQNGAVNLQITWAYDFWEDE